MEPWLENDGNDTGSFPQTTMATPRNTMEAPTVMITSDMGWGSLTGRMANRSNRMPTIETPATVRTKARGRGSLSCPHRVTSPMAPNMANSPWAKLISSVDR